jgi:hypothetical protein
MASAPSGNGFQIHCDKSMEKSAVVGEPKDMLIHLQLEEGSRKNYKENNKHCLCAYTA